MNKALTLLWAIALIGCADPAFQQYTQNRQAAIASMPNGAYKYQAQAVLDQQILEDKRRQQAQAQQAAMGIAAGLAAGADAYNASRPVYVYPVYRPYWYY